MFKFLSSIPTAYIKVLVNLLVMFITVFVVWQEINSKRKKFILILTSFAFVFISLYIDLNTDSKTDSITTKNDSLQTAIMKTTNLLNLNQWKQYQEDQRSFKKQLETLDSVTQTISYLNQSSLNLRHNLTSNQMHSDSLRLTIDKKRFIVFEREIENGMISTYYLKDFWTKDSSAVATSILTLIDKSILLFDGQYDNMFLLTNKELYNAWNVLKETLSEIRFELYYNNKSLSEVRYELLKWLTAFQTDYDGKFDLN